VFNDYPLAIIYLPKTIDLSTKLEIFRRINEGGTPLTAQDIRLSYYSESDSVIYVRLAGIHAGSTAAQRMLESGKRRGIQDPWAPFEPAEFWREWWEDKAKAIGQTPSEMFLWYLVSLHRNELDRLVASVDTMKHLQVGFRGNTEEALDIYCAQLQYTDQKGGALVFPTYGKGLEKEFSNFAVWVRALLSRNLVGLSVDKYKQMALFISAAVELGVAPERVSHDAWDAIGAFVRTPRRAGEQWLQQEGGYPEQKGRWSGEKGQKTQCDRVLQLLRNILKTHP